MKGTIDAAIPNAEEILLSDPKETAEHYTIVDLMRNDLSIVSDNIQVERFKYITKIKTSQGSVLQMSSEISGNIKSSYRKKIGSIIKSLLPAGSISGAPKTKTVDIIQSIEQEPRGYYTGIAGFFDGESLDTCVLIRFIEMNENNQLYFRSGGGITSQSNIEKEYDEYFRKIYLPIF